MRLHIVRLALLVMALFSGRLALAAAGQAEVRLQAWQVVSEQTAPGHERLQPLGAVKPGDTIEYEATCANGSAQTARDVQLTLPVPAGGLRYIAHAGAPQPDSASLDGQHFEPLPLQREVTTADGRRVKQAVPLSEYRFLRWSLGDLPAGARRRVHARMQLPALAPAADTAR